MSQDASGPERRAWRPRDAAWAVGTGLLAAVIASLPFGTDPGARAIFGVVVPAQTLGTLGALVFMARRRSDWRTTLALRAIPADAFGMLLGGALQIGLSLIAYWVVVVVLGGDVPNQDVVEIAAGAISAGERFLVVVAVVVLGPIAEEAVFRGVLLGSLRRIRSDRFAIVVSAAAFAALHLLDPNALFAVPFLFVIGLVMGRAVVSTGRLGRSIAIHAGFNLVSVIALFTA